jgi:preprotein translocase subunit YajC
MLNKASFYFFTALLSLQSFALFAQIEGEPLPPRDQNPWQMFSVLAIALLFFYFILWRPEQKRRKALEQQRNLMKKGDRATAMGILGTVVKVNEHSVILRMVDGSKIEVLKAAITDVAPGSEEDSKANDE